MRPRSRCRRCPRSCGTPTAFLLRCVSASRRRSSRSATAPTPAPARCAGAHTPIGVVIAEFGTPFQLEIAQAIADELEPTPFQVVVVAGGTTPERQKPRIEGLIDRQVDGLVLVAPWLDAASIEQIGQGLPIVTVALHGTPKHFDTVVDDEGLGARLVVDHLVALGHRRIVHTSTASGAWEGDFVLSHTARRQGFEQAMRDHDLEPDDHRDLLLRGGRLRGGATGLRAGTPANGHLRRRRHRRTRSAARRRRARPAGPGRSHGCRLRQHLHVHDQPGVLDHGRPVGSRDRSCQHPLLLERINGRTEPKQFVVAPKLIARRTSGPPRPASVQQEPATTDVA